MTLSSNLDDIIEIINKNCLTRNVGFRGLSTVTTVINLASSVHNIYMGSLVGNNERKIYIQKIRGFDKFDELVELVFEQRI